MSQPTPDNKHPHSPPPTPHSPSPLHPERYHGHGARAPFFEGWYYKLVDAGERHRYAVIPGVSLNAGGEGPHAFVQVLDGVTGKTAYHTYPLSEFHAARDAFDVRIGPNRFTAHELRLNLPLTLQGHLTFRNLTPWPVTPASPGIMGWYAWVPRMECYHGVLSLDHAIEGTLTVTGGEEDETGGPVNFTGPVEFTGPVDFTGPVGSTGPVGFTGPVDFTGGRGYIEKDWGQAFPSAWVWMQTNHFDAPGTSLTASVATIPWLGRAFQGFIVGLLHRGVLYRFATYTGARIERLEVAEDRVAWTLRDRLYRLSIEARRTIAGDLRGPTRSDMGLRVPETLDAAITVRLAALHNRRVIFEGTGRHGGMEVAGDITRA